jgi:hypothetical protein
MDADTNSRRWTLMTQMNQPQMNADNTDAGLDRGQHRALGQRRGVETRRSAQQDSKTTSALSV